MKLRATLGNLIIKRDNSGSEVIREATVVSVGPQVDGHIHEGDTILIGPHAGHEFYYMGHNLMIIDETDIVAVVEA